MTRHILPFLVIALFSVSNAFAHYLWVTVDSSGKTNIYFEGGPGPGDGKYLDPFIERGKSWFRTANDPKPKELELQVTKKPGKRWLSAELPKGGDRAIEMYGKWGVFRYGNTDVLLHYYGRHLNVSSNESLKKLSSATHLDLDIVLTPTNDGLRLQVLWKGKPAAGRSVNLRGPGLNKNLKTDDKGTASFKPEKSGRYTLRTSVEEDRVGKDDGKDFQKVRHHCTLTVNLPVSD
ncbi:MAG: hypothetical protein IH991_23030 [Planctomycetes bacterium]|nr:hypothetical protein [Planctomycetota bacterium]